MTRVLINRINQKRGRHTGLAALAAIFILFGIFRLGDFLSPQKKNAAESFDLGRVKSSIPFIETANAQTCWTPPSGGGGGGGGCGDPGIGGGCAPGCGPGCGCGPGSSD